MCYGGGGWGLGAGAVGLLGKVKRNEGVNVMHLQTFTN